MEYGSLTGDQVKGLKEGEAENAVRRPVSDVTLKLRHRSPAADVVLYRRAQDDNTVRSAESYSSDLVILDG